MSATTKGGVKETGEIVIDARYVRERPSGIGVMVNELVERLPALLPEERFRFLRHPKARSPLSTAPNTTDQTITAEANGPLTLVGLPTVARLSSAKLFFAPFNLLPFAMPCPSVVTVHDLMWLDSPALCRSEGAWGRVETGFYQTGLREALRSATLLLTPSQATKDAIAVRSPAASARTRVVPHGVDRTFFTGPDDVPDAATLARLVPGAARYVLTVGQAAGYKNHSGAVRGFAHAFASDPRTHLVLVQRLGTSASRLLALAEILGIRNQVHVLSALSFPELVALLRGALCLLHPSFAEGWGMPITEAMAAGCPVLTSDRSCMPEVAGGAAHLVNPDSIESIGEGLRRIAADAPYRAGLRSRGLARAGELSWAKHAETTAGLLRDVASGRI